MSPPLKENNKRAAGHELVPMTNVVNFQRGKKRAEFFRRVPCSRIRSWPQTGTFRRENNLARPLLGSQKFFENVPSKKSIPHKSLRWDSQVEKNRRLNEFSCWPAHRYTNITTRSEKLIKRGHRTRFSLVLFRPKLPFSKILKEKSWTILLFKFTHESFNLNLIQSNRISLFKVCATWLCLCWIRHPI